MSEVNVSEKHPCFNKEAKHKYGRVHLPVARSCNVQCNYCDRKFDCVNESRPGVTSKVLTPYQALEYVKRIKQHDGGRISVVGIAGPGDPMAEPENTLESIRLVKEAYPEMTFCLSTNGLNVVPYMDKLHEYGVNHLTITINGLDTSMTAEVYKWIRFKKKMYRGEEGARILLEQQLEAIIKAKELGFVVKVNTIVMPSVNEDHIVELAAELKNLNVDIINCIPMVPVETTPFGALNAPSGELMTKVRAEVSEHLPQMLHCARCRADAVGLLGKDMPEAVDLLAECAELSPLGPTSDDKKYVAVASYEGILVNRHLGDCETIYVYGLEDDKYKLIEKRAAPPKGLGDSRWKILTEVISDCRAFLVNGVGSKPSEILKEAGIDVIMMSGLIDEGLDSIYKGKKLKSIVAKKDFKCGAGSSCGGNAMGCC